MSSFDVSIVFVVYRTPDFLERALDALARVAPKLSYEVFIEDNAPEDDRSERVAEAWAARGVAPLKYRKNVQNLGLARALNQSIAESDGRHVLNLNPDVEVSEGSIEALVEYLDENPDCGIVAPRLHYADGTLQDSCRTFYSLPIFLLRRTFLGKIFPDSRIIRDHLMLDWDHEDTRVVDWAIGGALLVRGEAIRDVGAMDERFFLYFEDVDWCYRMHQRGWKVVYHPASRMIHHYQRSSAGWKPSRGLFLHLASTVRFYEKWSFILYWFKRRSGFFRKVAFFTVDLVAVVLAFLIAYQARKLAADILVKPLFSLERYSRFLGFSVVAALGTFLGLGHYRRRFPTAFLDNFFPVLRALAWTSVLMMISTFLISARSFSRVVVILFLPLAAILVTLGRVLLARAIDSVKERDVGLLRVGILGSEAHVAEVMSRFERYGRFGMEPVPVPLEAQKEQTPQALLRALRAERVREVLVFEESGAVSNAGADVGSGSDSGSGSGSGSASGSGSVSGSGIDLPAVVAGLHGDGVPVRVVPRIRNVLPARGELEAFLGIPAIRLSGASQAAVADPAKRALDMVGALAYAVIGAIPFLVWALGRRLRGRPVLESAKLRGRAGQPLNLYLAALPQTGPGSALMRYYPSWGHIFAGQLSWVGIYPYTEEEWEQLDEGYRAAPPAAQPGVLGPWLGAPDLRDIHDWNQRYPQDWSGASDARILFRALRGQGPVSGGGS